MTPEEISSIDAKIASSVTELSARLKVCEDKLVAQSNELAAADKTLKELSAKHEDAVKELTAKMGTEQTRLELTAQTVAKEFAKHTGQSGRVAADGASAGAGAGEPTAGAKFVAAVLKEYSTTKSQGKALDTAIASDPKGYVAYRAENLPIKWA